MVQRTGQLRSVVSGDLSLNTRSTQVIAARFAGTGDFSSHIVIPADNNLYGRLNGAGSLSVHVNVGGRAIVSFAEFELTEAGATAHQGAVSFAGAGTLSAYLRQNNQAAVILGGLGNLQVLASLNQSTRATFNGAGA